MNSAWIYTSVDWRGARTILHTEFGEIEISSKVAESVSHPSGYDLSPTYVNLSLAVELPL